MVHLLAVAQLVDHHAVDDLRRTEHQQAVEIQIPFGGAAAPAAFLVADGDVPVGHPHQRCEIPHSLRDEDQRLIRQLMYFFHGQPGFVRQALPAGLGPVHIAFDFVAVLLHEGRDFFICAAKRRADQHPVRRDLRRERLSAAADDRVVHVIDPQRGICRANSECGIRNAELLRTSDCVQFETSALYCIVDSIKVP